MAKKTVPVITMLEYANHQLQRTDEFMSKDLKIGICIMIEKVLRESKSYNGFEYLIPGEFPLNSTQEYSRKYHSL